MPFRVDSSRSLDHLNPADEGLIRRMLDFVSEQRGKALPLRWTVLDDTLGLLAEWRLPTRCFLLAISGAALGSGPAPRLEARLRAEIERAAPEEAGLAPEIVRTAAALARLSDADFLRQPSAAAQQAPLRTRLPALFHMAYNDLTALLVCVAEHVVLMQSLERLDERHSRLVADSNMCTYGPILEMLGMWGLRMELGDAALQITEPGHFKRLKEMLDAVGKDRVDLVETIRQGLAPAFTAAGMPHELSFRPTRVASIHRQLTRGGLLADLTRQVNVALIVPSLDQCYQALGHVHRLWSPVVRTPLGGGFQDRVAAAKYNGFRALITTVGISRQVGAGHGVSTPVEFRIVSDEMHRINNLGVLAARFLPGSPLRADHAWWARPNPAALLETEVLADGGRVIKVLSAAGEVIALPEKSTPIDFAYRIHREVGRHCRRIWVNGQSALYSQVLKPRDIVEIEVAPDYEGPDPDWLDVVQTSTARNQIRRSLKQVRGATSRRGREIVAAVLKAELIRYRLSDLPPEEFERYLMKVAGERHYINVDAMLSELAGPPDRDHKRKPVSPQLMVSEFIRERLVDYVVRAQGEPVGIRKNRIRFAECRHTTGPCRAAPGTPIVGRILQKGEPYEALVIYRRDCPNAPVGQDSVPLGWLGDHLPGQSVKVAIKAVDRARLLGTITDTVYGLYDEGIWLHGAEARVAPDRSAVVRLTIDARRYGTLEKLREALAGLQHKGVVDEFEISGMDPIEKSHLLGQAVLPDPYTQLPAVDVRVFKGREKEIHGITAALSRDKVFVLISGMNRMGKTSLLRYVEHHVARPCGFVPVYVSMHDVPTYTEAGFWTHLGEKLELAVAGEVSRSRHGGGARQKRPSSLDYERFMALLDQVEKSLSGRLVILLDEFNVIEGSFNTLQDRRQTLHHLRSLIERGGPTAFIVSVQERVYRQVEKNHLTQPLSWGIMRLSKPIHLDVLDPISAERLVREPLAGTLEFEGDVVAKILELTGRHPFHIHSLMHQLIQQAEAAGGTRQTTLGRTHLDAAVGQFMDLGYELFFDFLEDYAGDKGAVLRALATLAGEANTGVPASAIVEDLNRQRLKLSHADVRRILENLHDLGHVAWMTTERDTALPRMRIPLFQRWLRQHRPELE